MVAMSSPSDASPRSFVRRTVVVAATLTVACSLLASSAASAAIVQPLYTEENGDIPRATPLFALPAAETSGTVNGKLDDTPGIDDWDDVFSVPLATNQKLTVEMTATAGTDFDLWLWKPGSTTVFDSDPNPHIANASQTRGTSTESFWYPASSTGTYYLDVFSDKATSPNKGSYRLTWSIEQLTAPDLTYTVDRTLVGYNGTAAFSGAVTFGGSALATNPVLFQRRLAGSKSWSSLNAGRNGRPTTLTNSSGEFAFRVRDITRKAEYRAIVWPSRTTGWRYGTPITVTPRAYLTRPRAPRTVYRNQKFAVRGYLKPRHTRRAKTVKVTAYRADAQVWRYAKNYNYSGYTQYRMSLRLPHRGRWKLVATTYADNYHAATQSKATYVTVK